MYKITTGRYRVKHTLLRRMKQWIIAHTVLTYAADECECELHDLAAFSPRNEVHAVHWIRGCFVLGFGLDVEKMQLFFSSYEPSRDLSSGPTLLSLLTELSRLPKDAEAKNRRVFFFCSKNTTLFLYVGHDSFLIHLLSWSFFFLI